MAKKWTNRNMPGALHFVTGNVFKRKPIFRHDKYCLAFLEELQELRSKRNCKIIAFVLMPDHFHYVSNPIDGDIQTSTGILKSSSAKRIVELAPEGVFLDGHDNRVWQESFKALPLWSRWMIDQKINYIHANPVKAGLCNSAEDYHWSSFRAFYRDEKDPLLAIDSNWFWEDDKVKIVESRRKLEDENLTRLNQRIERNRLK